MPTLYAGHISLAAEKSPDTLSAPLILSDFADESTLSFLQEDIGSNPFSNDPFPDARTYSTAPATHVGLLDQQRNDSPLAADADQSSIDIDTFIESILSNDNISSFFDTNNASSHEIVLNNLFNEISYHPDTLAPVQAVQPATSPFFDDTTTYDYLHAASDSGDILNPSENRCISDEASYSILHVNSTDSLTKKMYKCNHPFCSFETIYHATIKDHMNTHSERAKTCTIRRSSCINPFQRSKSHILQSCISA